MLAPEHKGRVFKREPDASTRTIEAVLQHVEPHVAAWKQPGQTGKRSEKGARDSRAVALLGQQHDRVRLLRDAYAAEQLVEPDALCHRGASGPEPRLRAWAMHVSAHVPRTHILWRVLGVEHHRDMDAVG